MKKKLIAIIMALALVLTLTPMAYADSPPGGTQQLIQINGKTASATMSATGTVNLKIVMPENDALNGVGSFTVNLTFDKEKLELTGLTAPDVEYKTSGGVLIANLEGSIGSTDEGGNFNLKSNYTAMNSSGELTFNAPSKDTSAENSNLLDLSGKTLINATFTVKENALNVGDKPGDETVEAAKKIASLFTLTKCEVTKHVAGDESAGTTKGGATEYIVDLAGGANTPTYCYAAATNSVEVVAGFEVSGTVTSYGSASNDLTITLAGESGSTISTLTKGEVSSSGNCHTQTYTFTGVPNGKYTLSISKKGHAPLEKEITVDGGALTAQDATLYLWGDVTGDGVVTGADAQEVLRYAVEVNSAYDNSSDKDYWLIVANVTRDKDANNKEVVTGSDAQEILRYAVEVSSALDALMG